MGNFHILADVFLVQRNICQIKSAMFQHVKMTSLNMNSEIYRTTFTLIPLCKEVDVGRKEWGTTEIELKIAN